MERISTTLQGFQQSFLPEVKAYWLENPRFAPDRSFTPEQLSTPEQTPIAKAQRRYSPGGQASGWLEERQGNTRRRVPHTSFYYCWYEYEHGIRRKRRQYIQQHLVSEMRRMVDERRPHTESLQVLRDRTVATDKGHSECSICEGEGYVTAE